MLLTASYSVCFSNAGKNYASADPVRNPDGGKGQRVRGAADEPKIVMKHNEHKVYQRKIEVNIQLIASRLIAVPLFPH